MTQTPTPLFPYGMATLRYRLLPGPIDLAPLRVLASRRLQWKAWSVTFSVLGASHAVGLERGEDRLTELLACVSGVGVGVPVIQADAGEMTRLCLHAEGLVCEIQLSPFALTESAELLLECAAESRLEVAYPACADAATPYTRIGWRTTAAALTVETVHTYPEESRGVRSRTVFREEAAST